LAVGAATLLAFQLQLVILWGSYYAHHPFRGYENAIATMAPFFSESPRSLLLVAIVLGAVALVASRTAHNVIRALVWIWGGAMLASVAWWVATPSLRNDSDMWPIDLVFLGVYLGFPIVVAGILGGVWRGIVKLRS
jgi:hypothetical protein